MTTRDATVSFIVDQASGLVDVTARKMFGEYALHADAKVVGLICDDVLYMKPTEQGRSMAGALDEAPAYRGARPSLIVPDELIEDREWLSELVRVTADALPAPCPKAPRKRRAT